MNIKIIYPLSEICQLIYFFFTEIFEKLWRKMLKLFDF